MHNLVAVLLFIIYALLCKVLGLTMTQFLIIGLLFAVSPAIYATVFEVGRSANNLDDRLAERLNQADSQPQKSCSPPPGPTQG